MKMNIIPIFRLSVLLSVFVIVSCKPSVKEAIEYNESIVGHHEAIDKKIALLVDTYDNYVPEEMDSAYSAALSAANEGIEFAKSLKPFHGDETYKTGALDLFTLYKSILETEHARIIELLKLPPEQFQQKQIDELDGLKSSSEEKMLKKIDEAGKIQAEFAKKFNFSIEDESEVEVE